MTPMNPSFIASSPVTVLLLLNAVLAAWLSRYAWQRRTAYGAGSLNGITAAVAIWSLGYAFEFGSASLGDKIFWAAVQYIGIVGLPVAWLIFALQHARRTNMLSPGLLLLGVLPVVTLLLA